MDRGGKEVFEGNVQKVEKKMEGIWDCLFIYNESRGWDEKKYKFGKKDLV